MTMIDLIDAFISALNQAEWPTLLGFVSPDLVFDDEQGERHVGAQAFRVAWSGRKSEYETFSDLVIMTDAANARAAAEFTMRGRRGDGERADFSVPAGAFFEIEDGRIIRFSLRVDPISLERMGTQSLGRP